jgi:transposase-like protein
MDGGRYLVEAHLKEGRSVASLARDHGLHPSQIHTLLACYRAEVEAGMALRSKLRLSSLTTSSHQIEGWKPVQNPRYSVSREWK